MNVIAANTRRTPTGEGDVHPRHSRASLREAVRLTSTGGGMAGLNRVRHREEWADHQNIAVEHIRARDAT